MARYPTPEIKDAREPLDFGLTPRALAFAKLYAENAHMGPTWAAREAGYSNAGKAAHVRACELLRDPRCIRAVLHYGARALMEARGPVLQRPACASASKWDPTFPGIKFLNIIMNLGNGGGSDRRPSGPQVFRIMRKKFKALCAIEAGSHFEALQHAPSQFGLSYAAFINKLASKPVTGGSTLPKAQADKPTLAIEDLY